MEEEQRHERRTSLSFQDEVENKQLRHANENNYTDMRLSVVSLVNDDQICEPDQKSYAMPAKSKASFTARNLSREDDEDESSNDEGDEYEEYGHLS